MQEDREKLEVILILVEGTTDETALTHIFQQIYKEKQVKFEVLASDVFADYKLVTKDVKGAIINKIEEFLAKEPQYNREDIATVIQMIDTDGAFIPVRAIREVDVEKAVYYEDHIDAKDRQKLITRNMMKREKINCARKEDFLKEDGIERYMIFFFSRNNEHVIHNEEGNLTTVEKKRLAKETRDKYYEKPNEFISFISDKMIKAPGNYDESWNYIMKDLNSLKRCSNIHLIFQMLPR